jgi:hypothetical protein
MTSTKSTILGISPGMRQAGIALIIDGKLVNWRVRHFIGNVSDQKVAEIVWAVEQLLIRYDVTGLAVKVNPDSRSSDYFEQIIAGLQFAAHNRGILFSTYKITDLYRECLITDTQPHNKTSLAISMLRKHKNSNLLSVYQKLCSRKANYSSKIFEAIAAAQAHYKVIM